MAENHPREELHRQVSLKRDLTTELDAVAEDCHKGTAAASSAVPYYPQELLDKFVNDDGNEEEDLTT
eukprot:8131526-Karenia_brevis.AAC.1